MEQAKDHAGVSGRLKNYWKYLIHQPLKIDSVMSVLGRKNYSSMLGILDTLKQTFKLYKLVENDSQKKHGNKISKKLSDCSHYGRRFLIPLSDTIKKSSSLVGFVVSRFILEGEIRYKILNENCGDFSDECRAVITQL
jgi:hypothetical protein